MIDYNKFLEKTKQSMISKYRVSVHTQLPDGSIADLTASRTYFSLKGFVTISQHLLIARIENAQIDDMRQLLETGYKFGKQITRVPFYLRFQLSYMIIPVIATSNPDKDLLEYAIAQPNVSLTTPLGILEYPVVLDLESGETHYRRKRSFVGAFFFSDMRNVVSRYIEVAEA